MAPSLARCWRDASSPLPLSCLLLLRHSLASGSWLGRVRCTGLNPPYAPPPCSAPRSVDSIPDWISWLRYLSLFFYSYNILTTNEVASLRLNITVRCWFNWSSVQQLLHETQSGTPRGAGGAIA